MATSPDRIRSTLQRVTGRAVREVRAVAQAATQEPEPWRAALFAAAPLVVGEYAPASAELALDWFDELREEASPPSVFTPSPRLLVGDDEVSAMVARNTAPLLAPDDLLKDLDQEFADMLAKIEAEIQLEVAQAYRDTIVENAADDPDAVGWQRFARPGACKFCLMLAARGAVYTRETATFAAHTTCHCVAGQSYDPDAPRADVLQYVASSRRRSKADRKRLRAYLNDQYPDAAG